MNTKNTSQVSTIQSQPISQLNNENSKYITVQKLEKDSDIRFSFFHVENNTEQIDITMKNIAYDAKIAACSFIIQSFSLSSPVI